MEALISSVVRKLIVSNEALLMSLAAGYQKLRDHSDAEGNRRTAPTGGIHRAGVLADLTFHNVSTINQVLGVMFGDHMKGLNLVEVGRLNTGFMAANCIALGGRLRLLTSISETDF